MLSYISHLCMSCNLIMIRKNESQIASDKKINK